MESGARPFGFVEFALVGVPLLACTVLIALALGPRVLPRRQPENARRDLSRHAETLAAHYGVDDAKTSISHYRGVTEVLVPPRSPFEGDRVFPGMRTEFGDLVVVAVHRGGDHSTTPTCGLTTCSSSAAPGTRWTGASPVPDCFRSIFDAGGRTSD